MVEPGGVKDEGNGFAKSSHTFVIEIDRQGAPGTDLKKHQCHVLREKFNSNVHNSFTLFTAVFWRECMFSVVHARSVFILPCGGVCIVSTVGFSALRVLWDKSAIFSSVLQRWMVSPLSLA